MLQSARKNHIWNKKHAYRELTDLNRCIWGDGRFPEKVCIDIAKIQESKSAQGLKPGVDPLQVDFKGDSPGDQFNRTDVFLVDSRRQKEFGSLHAREGVGRKFSSYRQLQMLEILRWAS